MKTKLVVLTFLNCALNVEAQLNIVAKSDGVREYTVHNALPYDSIANIDKYNLASMPGQTLFMHGAKYSDKGYYEAFFTANWLDGGKTPVYKVDGVSITPAKEVEGKYYDVVKVWIKPMGQMSKNCLLLRERESGDEIYYNPNSYLRGMTCLGFYEKLKRYVGQTFLSLGKPVETEDGKVITPAEGAEYRCVDIGLKMNSDGAFLIMQGGDGVKVEAFPVGDEVYEFVSKERISLAVRQYGKKYGEKIAFGKVDIGMTGDMVLKAWGEPYRKSEVRKEGKRLESWSFSYNRYVELQDGVVVRVWTY